ncbi:zinc knuckle CX2CX4HX4C containing protein, partial [Tanacetum coccineum]
TPVTVNVVADNNGNVQSTNSLNSKASMSGDVNKLLSYASMVKSDDIPVSLEFIPTLFTENGNEVVIFDEEIVKQGSERWCLTVCGHFVGFDMHISELRYNIRRMWGKFGIVEIDRWKNGWYMFKFRDEIGMNAVLEKGPWMVRNKPLFVQKWNSEIGMSKVEPKKLPVWVKLKKWMLKRILKMKLKSIMWIRTMLLKEARKLELIMTGSLLFALTAKFLVITSGIVIKREIW